MAQASLDLEDHFWRYILNNQREIIGRIIEKFRNCPCLWKKHHPDYRNALRKNAALDSFIGLFKLVDPEADRESVRNKLNYFLRTYNIEREKVNKCLGLYEPSLWFYKRLEFLEENTRGPPMLPNSTSSPYSSPSSSSSSKSSSSVPRTRRTKHTHTSFGVHVVKKMQSLPPSMVVFCQKLINDAIFYAEIVQLDATSKIVTVKPRMKRMRPTNHLTPQLNVLDVFKDLMKK